MDHGSFQVLGHTADVRLRVRGRDLPELFTQALRGMASIQKAAVFRGAAGAESLSVRRRVEIASVDVAALLVDFLNEALWLSHTHREAYVEVAFSEFSVSRLVAELRGFPVGEFDEDVKAVTYHGLQIRKTDAGYEAEILFDI